MSGSFGKMEFGMSRELMGIINLENKGAAGWSVWGLRTGEQKALDCMRCAVGHCDICATANAVSDAVRGWHRDCHWDHQANHGQ